MQLCLGGAHARAPRPTTTSADRRNLSLHKVGLRTNRYQQRQTESQDSEGAQDSVQSRFVSQFASDGSKVTVSGGLYAA